MLELNSKEILEITGGAPSKKTSIFYDIMYCIGYGVTWFLGQGDEMIEAVVRQDAKHVF